MAKVSVYDKIIAKGNLDAKEIIERGNQKALEINKQVQEEANKLVSNMLNEAKEKNQDLIKTKKAELEQDYKQRVLLNQKELIKNVFDKALDTLINMDDDKLIEFVTFCFNKSNIEEDVVIKVNNESKTKYRMLFSSKNDNNLDILASKLGCKYAISLLGESLLCKGGFVIIGKYYDIDNTYEGILKGLLEIIETDVASILFKEV